MKYSQTQLRNMASLFIALVGPKPVETTAVLVRLSKVTGKTVQECYNTIVAIAEGSVY